MKDQQNNSVSRASIRIEKCFQIRAEMDQAAIEDYIQAIREAGHWPFPPIKIVSQYLVDGFHRIEAAKRVAEDPETPAMLRKSLQEIPCERVPVDLSSDDVTDLALQQALGANHTHGLRRSIADKRRAVELALEKWPDQSDREIAKLTGTSHTFVSKLRGQQQVATLPLESEPASGPNVPWETESLPPKLEAAAAPEDPGGVEPSPRAKQRACGGSDEHRPNPEEAAKHIRNIAKQHRIKLVDAIDDYNNLKPNYEQRDRLVKIVQSVELW